MEHLTEEALRFAAERHRGQRRKVSGVPYILHPVEVMAIAGSITDDEEILAAAVLHDVVEDTATTSDEVRERFGDRVADLVASETENKYTDRPATETWVQRKLESLMELQASDDPAVKILWLSDKLSNIRSMYASWRTGGDVIWRAFHQKNPAMHAWYYRSIDALIRPVLGDTLAMEEYERLLNEMFAAIPDTPPAGVPVFTAPDA